MPIEDAIVAPVVVPETTIETIKTEEETTTPPEVTPENPDADIDTILDALLKEDEPVISTEPTFPTKDEDKKVDEEDIMDDAILKALDDVDASFIELEAKLEESDKSIETLTKDLEDSVTKAKNY
jgi:hypothetical protein